MTTQNPPPIPPDFEDRHTLALTLCQHLGINPQHVLLGSMQIELGPDHQHRVTWTGHATLNLDDLTRLIVRARAPVATPDTDTDCTHPLRRYDGRCVMCGKQTQT